MKVLGPANDIQLVRDTLMHTYGLADSDVVVLGEKAGTGQKLATYEGFQPRRSGDSAKERRPATRC